jgi:AcrR family transcriptional regulator
LTRLRKPDSSAAKRGNKGVGSVNTPKRRRSVVPPEAQSRQDRRSDILKSAEKLFAERGFNGVSVRDIADDARVPLALVGYYFGKKAELFATIFEQRRDYFERRVALIESVDTADHDGDLVEQVVRAWAEPALMVGLEEGGEAFATLVARGLWDAGIENRRAIERHFDQVAHAFLKAMAKALPNCEPGRLIWGYQYAVGSLLTHMVSSRVEDLSSGAERTGDTQRRDELIRFLASGFRALAEMDASGGKV